MTELVRAQHYRSFFKFDEVITSKEYADSCHYLYKVISVRSEELTWKENPTTGGDAAKKCAQNVQNRSQ
jgi:hypothetical protein